MTNAVRQAERECFVKERLAGVERAGKADDALQSQALRFRLESGLFSWGKSTNSGEFS